MKKTYTPESPEYAAAIEAALAYMEDRPEWQTDEGMAVKAILDTFFDGDDTYTNSGHLLAGEVRRLRAIIAKRGQ